MTHPADRLLLRPVEAAEALGVSLRTIMALVAQDAIPYVHLGKRNLRFPVAELQAWIQGQTRGIVPPGHERFPHVNGVVSITEPGAAETDAIRGGPSR